MRPQHLYALRITMPFRTVPTSLSLSLSLSLALFSLISLLSLLSLLSSLSLSLFPAPPTPGSLCLWAYPLSPATALTSSNLHANGELVQAT